MSGVLHYMQQFAAFAIAIILALLLIQTLTASLPVDARDMDQATWSDLREYHYPRPSLSNQYPIPSWSAPRGR